MTCFSKNKCLVGFCALAAVLLAATWAGAIGESKKPRPPDEPLALGEPSDQGMNSRATSAAAKSKAGEQRIDRRPARRTTPVKLVGAEERKHLGRMARINRIQVLGIETENQVLVDLARDVRDMETRRHELAMKRLERSLSTGGGR
ncbi:MAG: hypothetical protein JRF63_10865 [Deltaproteobacteria bacterium]|nr:hypothetical protein [Deltaproteobacteria bacterium]